MNKPKLWTKDFTIITASIFFLFLTFYLLMTTLAVYAIKQFSASQSQAGLASSIFIIGALVARIFAGKYIDAVGRKKLLFIGLGLFLIATVAYFVSSNLTSLLIVRFIHGTAFGTASTAMATSIMHIIPGERRGEGTGYYSLSITIASAIGPFLGIFITQHANYDMIFAACTAFAVISIFVMLFAKIPEVKLTQEQRKAMKGFKLKDCFEKKAVPISLIGFIMGMAYSGILSYMNLYAMAINLTKIASFFFIVYSIVCLISRPASGRLLDTKGDNAVMYPSLISFIIGLAVLSQARNGFTLLLSGVFIALGYGTSYTSIQAIAVKTSPNHRIALATSTFFILMDAGMGVGPLIIGSIVPAIGFRNMYVALAVIVALSTILYYFVHGRRATIQQTEEELTA